MYKYAASYLQNAKQIIEAYAPNIPFAAFLKQYFAANKKFGSKDRKAITQACYAFFRIGNSEQSIDVETKILIGLFLTDKNLVNWQHVLPNNWINGLNWHINEKIDFLQKQNILSSSFSPFSWKNEVTASINFNNFSGSHLQQPNSFIRIRNGFEHKILSKINALPINVQVMDKTLAFQENFDVHSFAILNKEVVVQDYSSQQIATLLQLIPSTNHRKKVWDCCAASGGKSILAVDVLGKIDLYVSDLRESILHNLKKRLAVAQISIQSCEVKDLSKPHRSGTVFDVIIADVPCTGSGTWGRTPENLVYFKQDEIINFQQLQQKIISNTIPSLKPNGYYLFITCSVFVKENEENVQFIQQKFGLQLIHQQYFVGFEKKADTLFGALFIKS